MNTMFLSEDAFYPCNETGGRNPKKKKEIKPQVVAEKKLRKAKKAEQRFFKGKSD